ncbi:MAG: hypothetical protein EAZ68_04120 [Oscillatoriales cyanobacterium]|nr:MAG: hypothetical protein EAZ68_04120 [Oscillatoriales cyanobacterium]
MTIKSRSERAPLSIGGFRAGLFHSPKNRDFVGVVRPLLPVPTPATNDRMGVSGQKGRHGGTAPTKNETALGCEGDLDSGKSEISQGFQD